MSENLVSQFFLIIRFVTINFPANCEIYFLDTQADFELDNGWIEDCNSKGYYPNETAVCGEGVDGLIPPDEYMNRDGFWTSCDQDEGPFECSVILRSATELDITIIGILAYTRNTGVNLLVTSTNGDIYEFCIAADGWTYAEEFRDISSLSPIKEIKVSVMYHSHQMFAILDQIIAMGDVKDPITFPTLGPDNPITFSTLGPGNPITFPTPMDPITFPKLGTDNPITKNSAPPTTTFRLLPPTVNSSCAAPDPATTTSSTTERTQPSKTTTFTTPITPFQTTTPSTDECRICIGIDTQDQLFYFCEGQVPYRDCTEAIINSTGHITWKCLSIGQPVLPNYNDCKSTWLINLVEESHQINDTVWAVEFMIRLQSQISESQTVPKYFGHEMGTIDEILGNLTKKVSNWTEEADVFGRMATATVSVAERLIANQNPWYQLDLRNRSKLGTKLSQTIEETSFLLTSKVPKKDVDRFYNLTLFSGNKFTVTSLAFQKSFSGLDKFQYPLGETQDSVIQFPPGWTQHIVGDKIECVGMVMDPIYASLIMPGQFHRLGLDSSHEGPKTVLNGQIMSFTITSDASTSYKLLGNETTGLNKINFKFEGVRIIFKHFLKTWGDEAYEMPRNLRTGEMPKAARGTAKCVFWDIKNLMWSQEGCKLISITESETICECNHLTSFAILMDVHKYVGRNIGLQILTIILSTISIVCLIFAIVIFAKINTARTRRTLITLHLAICLVIGSLLVLLFMERDNLNLSEGVCIASGIVTQYIFLAAFGWMAIQGLHLYRMVLNPISLEKTSFLIYKMLSYGGPLVIIVITNLAGYFGSKTVFQVYEVELVCWLKAPYMFLGFIGPVLIIVLINAGILLLSLRKSYQIRNPSPSTRIAGTREIFPVEVSVQRRISSFRSWIRGSLALTVLLGITWLTGYLMLAPPIPGIVAAYFFTVLNASQGIFIFSFECFFNDKVRQAIHRQYGQYLPERLDNWLKNTNTRVQIPESLKNKVPTSSPPVGSCDNSRSPVLQLRQKEVVIVAPVPRCPSYDSDSGNMSPVLPLKDKEEVMVAPLPRMSSYDDASDNTSSPVLPLRHRQVVVLAPFSGCPSSTDC